MKYSVAIPEMLQRILFRHLVRADGQEDCCFALYNPSQGSKRLSAVLKEIVLPLGGERQVHGNVSFNPAYYDRVCDMALEKGCGICFMHSHPGPGWQNMSSDDVKAETMLAPRVMAISRLPLLGMTTGKDATWSARFWIKKSPGKYERKWCESVRVAGKGLRVDFYDTLLPKTVFGKAFTRTLSAWGDNKQAVLSRLRVGIVGLGSVGSVVAEGLYKSGVRNIVFLDFDTVELKNLDRLQGIGKKSIGEFKVDVVKKRLVKQQLFANGATTLTTSNFSVIEEAGLLDALNCDIIFCCVDRPWPRYVLNCIAYANCIPVIDGGIDTAINDAGDNLSYARWKAHTVGPHRICLNCLQQYVSEDVGLEQSGLLDDPVYISGLPKEHFINRGENVFAFSVSLAAMELQQFLSLVLQPRGQYYGPKEFDFNSGNTDDNFPFECNANCSFPHKLGEGDKINKHLAAKHPFAETQRAGVKKKSRITTFINNLFNLMI